MTPGCYAKTGNQHLRHLDFMHRQVSQSVRHLDAVQTSESELEIPGCHEQNLMSELKLGTCGCHAQRKEVDL